MQSKTQNPVRFEISEGTRASVVKWMEDPLMVGSEFLWPGRFHERLHVSTRHYARSVRDCVSSIGLEVTAYGTHSMRRTKVTRIYKKTGNLRAIRFCWGIRRWTALSGPWVLNLKMRWQLRKLLKSKRLGRSTRTAQSGPWGRIPSRRRSPSKLMGWIVPASTGVAMRHSSGVDICL